jgi:hypothetical protein
MYKRILEYERSKKQKKNNAQTKKNIPKPLHIMLKKKENIRENWTRVAGTLCEQAPNQTTTDDMMECALI